jgi:hypothetical protein
MRQLYVFEAVDGDGHIAEVACLAADEDDAIAMLTAEGYEGSFVGAIPLGSDPGPAFPRVAATVELTTFDLATADASTSEPVPLSDSVAVVEEALPDGPGLEELERQASATGSSASPSNRIQGDDEDPIAPLPLTALHAAARDYAMLSVYAVGMDVATVARAAGVTPREAARRLGFHLLGTVDEGTRRTDASRMTLDIDDALSSVPDLYAGGMSISEIVDALSRSATDIVWSILDAPARVVAVTPAVMRTVRGDLDRLKDASAQVVRP